MDTNYSLFINNNLIPLERIRNKNISIKCKDMDGYFFNISAYDLERRGLSHTKIVNKNNPHSIHNIHQFLKNKNLDIILVSDDYVDNKSKLIWKCLCCGNDFELSWQNFRKHPRKVCSRCSRGRNGNLKYNIEYVTKECERHGLKKVDNIYIDARTPFLVEDENGYRDMKCLSSISCGKTQIRFMIRNPYLFYNMRRWFQINNYNCDVVEQEYKSMKEKMVFICACGRRYKCLPSSIFYNSNPTVRCPRCSGIMSSYEVKVSNFLKKKKIHYLSQYRFNDCKLIKPLPFDFYLPDYNICIEVDGEQHFKPKMQTKQEFENTQVRDKIKSDYCKKNGIKLIRIPYWELNNKKYKNKLNKILMYD